MIKLIANMAFGLAGCIHLVLAPQHYAHAPAHGIFFILAGIAEVIWAAMFWKRPSATTYYIGLILAGGLLILWVLTRFLIPPFEHEPGPIDAGGLLTKMSESAGMILLFILARQGQIAGFVRRNTARMVGIAIGLAVISGIGAYQVGMAAEPLFPGLGGGAENGYEESMPGMSTGHNLPSGGSNTADVGDTPVVSGDLRIEGAWARPSTPGIPSAVYLIIINGGQKPDRLTGVQTDIATAEIHQSQLDGNVVKMVPVPEGIEISAGGRVEIRPGGYHIMLVGLKRELKPGDEVEITLSFEKSPSVTVKVTVQGQ